jgi:hypothetical protein
MDREEKRREEKRREEKRNPPETFCIKPETRPDFLI